MSTATDALLEVLADAGVRHVFGIPGDAVNAIVDGIRKSDRLAFVHVRHEEAGAFAASAQAKLDGRLAAVVGTSGPGAIHLLNGLYDAAKDHAPVIAITGETDTSLLGTDAHQEVQIAGNEDRTRAPDFGRRDFNWANQALVRQCRTPTRPCRQT